MYIGYGFLQFFLLCFVYWIVVTGVIRIFLAMSVFYVVEDILTFFRIGLIGIAEFESL